MREESLSLKAELPREMRGRVVATNDPQGLLRVQVRVPGLWDAVPDADLPWAEYRLNGARVRGGEFEPAEVGDWVWVDFPNGDTRYPRITGWCHYAPGGVPNLPHEAFAGPQSIQHKRDGKIGEPEPQQPVYHGSRVLEKFGFVIEINPAGELLATQRATGTAIRVTADGSATVHSENKLFLSSASDALMHFGGDFKLLVDGNWDIDVGGVISEQATQHVARKR